MTATAAATVPFLDLFEAAAGETEAAESRYRREAAQRIQQLEQERAFAFRRLNLMRAIAEAVAGAEGEEIAVASALVVLRSKLGWSADSEARTELLSRFTPVAQAVFHALTAAPDAKALSVPEALAAFEAWYAGNRPTPFWVLFEHYIPETPQVDF
ncbi:hypothetical protein FRZ61_14900 [Hypericibacter adhaerens]|uniref:Uncharacterized protein n=1 Tax=Hypericibacter adhaerens TaxID=2602016 RepID=A0A5J6MWC3_9PROT|nr:hypothetical protein [Hypericibacter adhaerens]QEX21561.1 hypothetical protein FRZ61_14900 [Hypericibacter adhaerens]